MQSLIVDAEGKERRAGRNELTPIPSRREWGLNTLSIKSTTAEAIYIPSLGEGRGGYSSGCHSHEVVTVEFVKRCDFPSRQNLHTQSASISEQTAHDALRIL